MASYEVSAPDGRRFRIEGDQPPGEDDLDKIFNQPAVPTFEPRADIAPETPRDVEEAQRMGSPTRELAHTFDVAGRGLVGGLADLGKVFFRPVTEELYPEQATPGPVTAPFENLEVAGDTRVPLPAKNLAPLPASAQFAGHAAQGLIETTPKIAGVAGLEMAGIPAPIAAGAVFGQTEQGFDPKQAAIAAGLPLLGRVSGGTVGTVAKLLGVESPKALNWMKGIAGTAGPAGAMLAEGEREISKLPKKQQETARNQLWESIAGQAALGPMGVRFEKGLNASQNRTSTQVHGDVRPQPGEGAGQVPLESSRQGVQPQSEAGASQEGQARVLLSDEEYLAHERQAIEEAERLGSPATAVDEFSGQTEDQPFAGAFMLPTQSGMEIRSPNFRSWLESIPKEKRAQAITQRVLEEHIHRHVSNEDAAAYNKTLTGLERAIEHRAYTGEWSPETLQQKRGVKFSESQLGHEAIRRRMQRLMGGSSSEVAEAALRERWTLKSLEALSDMVRNVREGFGTKASGEGVKLLNKLEDNLSAARAAVSGQQQPGAFQKEDTSDAVQQFEERLKAGQGGNKISTEAGLGAKSISDLEALKSIRETAIEKRDDVMKRLHSATPDKQGALFAEAMKLNSDLQLAREAIEVATDTGSWQESEQHVAPLGDRPMNWRDNPEVADWLKEHGKGLGITLPDELAQQPAAFQKDYDERLGDIVRGNESQAAEFRRLAKEAGTPVMRVRYQREADKLQRAADAIKAAVPEWEHRSTPAAFQKEFGLPPGKPGEERGGVPPLKGELPLTSTTPGEARPSATELGAKAFTARDLEQAGEAHIKEQTSRVLSQLEAGKRVTPISFDDYQTAMQHKYGDLKPGQLFEGYQDTLNKTLLSASGRELEALAKSVGVKTSGKIADPSTVQGFGLKLEPGSRKVAEQMRAEEKGASQRQRYRNSVISRVAEKLLSDAAPETKTPSRTNISPEDLRLADETKQPGFFDISRQDTTSPGVLAQRLVQDARRSGRDPVILTKRLTALMDKQSGRVYLVSTYPSGRTGAMLLDPSVSTIRAHRPLSQILARYRPLASLLLDEPVQNFKQAFDSVGDFEAKLATDARRASQQVFEEPLREGEQPEPGSWEHGAPITDAEAASIMDHITSEVGKFNEVTDVQASLAALKEDSNPQVLSAYRKLSEELLRRNPDLSDEGLINQLAQNIYDNHATAPDLETFVKRTMAQGRAENRPSAPLAGEPGPSKTSKELTMPIRRRPPTDIRPENIPAEAAARLATGTRPAPTAPEGSLVPTSPAGAIRLGEGEPPAAFDKALAAAKDEVERVRDAAKLLTSRSAMVGDVAKTIDQVDNRKNNEAIQQENNIRLASVRKPTGVARFTQPWQRGNKEVLAAANAVVESQGIQSKLADFRAKLQQAKLNAETMAQSGSWRERRLAKAYEKDIAASLAEVEYADAHWNDPELKETARRVKRALDQQYALEKSSGFDLNKEPGYVPHRLLGVWGGAETLFQLPRVIGTKYRMPRTFPTHYDALESGPYMRVTHDVASLVGHRVRQGLGNIYRHEWKAGLLQVKFPDGTPMALPAKQGKHGAQSPNPAYKVIDTNGLGPIAVHEDIYKPLRSLLAPSYFDDAPIPRAALHLEQMLKHSLLIGDFFHFARMAYYGGSIIGKQVLGLGDAGRLGKSGWSALDIAEPNVREAIRKGVISQKDADWANARVNGITRRQIVEMAYKNFGANLGKVSDALYKDLLTDLTPTAGPVQRGIHRLVDPSVGRYNRFLFERMTRGIMAESIVSEFERQSKAKPNASPDALMRDISRDVNERFGNIGRQGVFKSKTAQDFARFLMLAPQWVEGMARTEARSYGRLTGASKLLGQRQDVTPLGTTGRSVGKGLVFMFGLTQAINMLTRGKPTWKNDEEGHKMDAWIPSWGSNKEGFWFSPLSVFNEVTHDLYRLGEAKLQGNKPVGDAAIDILSNKESPISRALVVMGTGKTSRGERITSTAGRYLTEPAKAMAPMPITFGKYGQAAGHALAPSLVPPVAPGAMQRQAFGTAGLKIEPAQSQPARVRRMAEQFMRESGLKKETGWEQVMTDEQSYTKLRQAIRDGDNVRAKKVYDSLLKGRTPQQIVKYMKQASRAPFTGNSKAEKGFIGSLDDKGIEAYDAARQQMMDDFERFADWYNQQE